MSEVCNRNKPSLRTYNIERTEIAAELERSALKREFKHNFVSRGAATS
jgi:hypothetical protein